MRGQALGQGLARLEAGHRSLVSRVVSTATDALDYFQELAAACVALVSDGLGCVWPRGRACAGVCVRMCLWLFGRSFA